MRRLTLLVAAAAALWAASCVSAVWLSQGALPFDRPMLRGTSVIAQVGTATFLLAFALLIIAVAWWLTRRRTIPDLALRAPAVGRSRQEVLALWLYGAIVLVVGRLLGLWCFGEGIGLHLNGSVFGATRLQTPTEVCCWAAYNFCGYALLPYMVFRRLGYSRDALSLRSADRRNDTLVVLVVLAIESALELAKSNVTQLSGNQLLLGGTLSFSVHLIGTGVPILIFIYAILMPRYMRLTGSAAAATLLGGLSYAALHIFEYWTVYDSPRHAGLSLLFVLLTFVPPGLVKAFLTLRTGNAWVHLWAYHAIAPHVTMDTPLMVKVFGLR
jgi:hypothetical protein